MFLVNILLCKDVCVESLLLCSNELVKGRCVHLCVSCPQFDTHPLGTVNLMLSDDFANEGFTVSNLSYCKGDVPCQYLDPWDLNWPRGMDNVYMYLLVLCPPPSTCTKTRRCLDKRVYHPPT